MSGFLNTWVGLLPYGVGLFSGERVIKNTPSLSSHLSSLPMGLFSRAYGTPLELTFELITLMIIE